MKSYRVTLMNENGDLQQIIVQSACPHGMQEFVDALVAKADPGITLSHPVVVDVAANPSSVVET